MKIQGIFVAAATPFDYKGEIYKVKVQHNIEKWNLTTVSGYAFATSAGEGPLLREEEKISLWQLAAQHAAPEKLLIADASAEGVDSSAYLAKRAAQAGFHAVLCQVPHHYRSMMYGADTQMLYFRSVADRSPLPVLIGNSPSYTGVDVSPESSAALSQHPNILGVVETGTPAGRIPQIREQPNPVSPCSPARPPHCGKAWKTAQTARCSIWPVPFLMPASHCGKRSALVNRKPEPTGRRESRIPVFL